MTNVPSNLIDRSSLILEIYSLAVGCTYSLCREFGTVSSRVDRNAESPVSDVADLLYYDVIRSARYLESLT